METDFTSTKLLVSLSAESDCSLGSCRQPRQESARTTAAWREPSELHWNDTASQRLPKKFSQRGILPPPDHSYHAMLASEWERRHNVSCCRHANCFVSRTTWLRRILTASGLDLLLVPGNTSCCTCSEFVKVGPLGVASSIKPLLPTMYVGIFKAVDHAICFIHEGCLGFRKLQAK